MSKIIIIDKSALYSEYAAKSLKAYGHDVSTEVSGDKYPDSVPGQALILLGCGLIGDQELAFIKRHPGRVFVLAADLDQNQKYERKPMSREAFLAGAFDVDEKPYDEGSIAEAVNPVIQAFENNR